MSRINDIEKALEAMNGAAFQELGDSFLALQNKNYRAYVRIGSQIGKQQTVKGTPDSLILLPSGKYLLIEYSTNRSSGVKKIKDDIIKCINPSKTSIKQEDISEIIVCINFNINTDEIESIKQILQTTRISLSIIMLDDLALQLHLNHRDLVHQYLGLPFDTGQIVSTEKFISEYNVHGNGIATPLDNTFCHREKELSELNGLIESSDFIILTGFPGVGKTRLALEAIAQFLKAHLSFEAYCISNKHHTLLDDLYSYIKQDEDCILFVDDANRIDFINQIIGFYKSTRSAKLKLIITVRDYAFESVSLLATGLKPSRFDVPKFTGEEIVDLIKTDPFKILNNDFQKEIVRIADGNPRLAIMASRLAITTQSVYALTDVSSLFENYFSTLIKDSPEFSNSLNLKVLGLIAFFYTIPYKDKAIVSNVLSNFGITYTGFIDSISKLEQLELVDIQFEHVKISEQNLGTYFFYRCFVKDNLLSFDVLLKNYFEKNTERFKDTVIPANNTFGPQKVMKKLRPSLKSYLLSISGEQNLEFLKTFWFYLQDETLGYIYTEVSSLPSSDELAYIFEDKKRNYSYDKNKYLELLSNFFWSATHLKDALELSFELIRKLPYFVPELIYIIKQQLLFEKEDDYEGFKRQHILLEVLISGVNKKDRLIAGAFYTLISSFLAFQFRHARGGGGRRTSIYLYEYYLPARDDVYRFREIVWNELNKNYGDFSTETLTVLSAYLNPGTNINKEIFNTDAQYIITIIEKNLNPEFFEHCRFVHNLVKFMQLHEVTNPDINKLSLKFTNPVFEIFDKFDWDRFKNRESYEFLSYEEFEKVKENEIRSSFRFNTIEEATVFYEQYKFLHLTVEDNCVSTPKNRTV